MENNENLDESEKEQVINVINQKVEEEHIETDGEKEEKNELKKGDAKEEENKEEINKEQNIEYEVIEEKEEKKDEIKEEVKDEEKKEKEELKEEEKNEIFIENNPEKNENIDKETENIENGNEKNEENHKDEIENNNENKEIIIEEKNEENIEEKKEIKEENIEENNEKKEEKLENVEKIIDNNIIIVEEDKKEEIEENKEEKKEEDKIEKKEENKEIKIEENKEEIIEITEEEEEDKESENINMERINNSQINHDYIFRISVVGDSGVGKTSLISRFYDNNFKENYNSTIGVDFRVLTLKYNNIITKLHIWDTAGQERFKSMALNFFKSTHGFVFVYDISVKESFESIQSWIDLAFSNSDTVGINFLVGNKCDREEDRKISKDDAKKFAKEKNLIFFETSAKNNENVEKVFHYFVYKLIQYFLKNKDKYKESNTNGTKIKNSFEDIKSDKKEEKKCGC